MQICTSYREEILKLVFSRMATEYFRIGVVTMISPGRTERGDMLSHVINTFLSRWKEDLLPLFIYTQATSSLISYFKTSIFTHFPTVKLLFS